MAQASIEIHTKDVSGVPYIPFKGDAQHLFIVYIDSTGKKTALRGGPETNNPINAFIGDIKITNDNYNENHVDWSPNAPKIEIASGTDAEMQALVDKMWAKAEAINREGFDYKLPLIGHVQNSNAAVKEMIKAAGLEPKLPKHHDGKKIWAPGVDGHFTHTFMDTYR
ncbi:hypothetical protein [Candidatus Jidaibacter acanthamoebae]|uniref:hypothetical protein n=1 Tax=Candidatus Jidaibacter acanthamoebae TaxID=86105 RepID=UPI0005805171|nr:hypothetical protein [Candidatus Jidaibacter acanthamoeba]